MIKQIFGLSNDDMAEITSDKSLLHRQYDILFSKKNWVCDWIEKRKSDMRFYGGSTNTVLNDYDSYTNIISIKNEREACFDLGGGFNTSEINRLSERSFTSLDIISPLITDYGEQLIIRKRTNDGKIRCLNNAEMSDYLDKQRQIPWIPFDVSENSIPSSHDSYFLTSTGFITSTVRPQDAMVARWCSEKIQPQIRYVVTSIVAMYRVIELVKTGKRIQFLSISRASSRLYTNKIVFLDWDKGKLIQQQTVPNKAPKNLMQNWLNARA